MVVKWSKTEPLFSTRHSKDKASGKSCALLKQRDKVPTPEVNEDFCVCTCSGKLLGSREGRGCHPKISVDTHPQVCDGIHLSKKLCMRLGEGPRTNQA